MMSDAVDNVIRSYSQVVLKTIERSALALSKEKLKEVVLEGVAEHVIVFGLTEKIQTI